MGVYRDQVLPRLSNLVLGATSAVPYRARACEGLTGAVVEIGFGSGLNVPLYPAAVTSVDAVEPAGVGWQLASKRVAASPVPVRRSGLDGQVLPFADDTFDSALSTWTLCTIPDPGQAVRELRRVLRPGGRFHFLEHGLAPDAEVQRWQHRIEPLQKRMAGGCHLTRQFLPLLEQEGFEVVEADVFYEKGAPRFLAADTLGVAVAP